ncbi:hypothetical protein [Nocardioides sp.]|uniref:hypothetical protein n=1 Tax=Nocardioides sp. TaxID=35761 RepID=UPI003517C2A9
MKSRLAYFALGIVLLGVSSLLAVPAQIHASGLAAFADIAVGQGLGGFCFAIITWGWAVTGPAAVASAGDAVRRQEFISSLLARLVVASVTLPLFLLIAIASAQTSAVLACLGLLSTALTGLCGNWYFTGTGEAGVLFFIETLPRIMGTIVGTGVMLAFSLPAEASLLGIVGGVLVAILLEVMWVRRKVAPDDPYIRQPLIPLIASQRQSATVSLVGAAYTTMPVVIVSHVNPSAVAVFAVLDKLNKQSVTAMQPILSVFQGWVPKTGRDIKRRAQRAIAITSGVALFHVAGYAVLGTFVIGLLSNAEVSATLAEAVLTGLAGSLYLLDAVVGRAAMVPLRQLKSLHRSTLACTIVGVSAVAALGLEFGAAGAMAGYCVGLTLRLLWGVAVVARSPDPQLAKRAEREGTPSVV